MTEIVYESQHLRYLLLVLSRKSLPIATINNLENMTSVKNIRISFEKINLRKLS